MLGNQECFESILYPGEVLYYGKHWSHATRNLVTPTTTTTGTVVHAHNYQDVASKLFGECARSDLRFDFSGRLCDALDKCYPLWHAAWSDQDPPKTSYGRSWRHFANPKDQAEKDKVKPTENNYDGRNHIGGN